jgi:hypothetical protein
MLLEISDTMQGVIIMIIVLPLIYWGARLAVKIKYVWTAYRLNPLSPLIDGNVDQGGPYLKGQYRGYPVRVSFQPHHQPNWTHGTYRINAIFIELYQVVGQQEWFLKYRQKSEGFFSESSVYIYAESTDAQLTQRLEQAGILDIVAALGGGSTRYETLHYSPQFQAFFYTTDVAPRKLPSRDQFLAQLEMLCKLVPINQQVNPVLPPTS